MRLFRNPEAKWVLYVSGPLVACALLLIYALAKSEVWEDWFNWAILMISGGVLLLQQLMFFFVLHIHFKKVIRFREKVANNTRGKKDLQFNDFSEGEFAILQDEIEAMTVAHFCQQEELQREKEKISQSLDDIMHQIRTPLFAITSTAQLQLEEPLEPQEQKAFAQRILKRTAQIDRMVTMRLNMSRMDAGVMGFHKEEIPAKALLQKACDTLDYWMEINEIKLEQDVPEDLMLEVDVTLLKEALSNIIKNCIEHTPVGGRISVRVTDGPVYTEIRIRDTGSGIDKDDLPHLFERFYRGKNPHSNSIGIGLAFAKEVVQCHNGIIKADNHPDGGAVFTIHLMKSNI